MSLIIDLSHAPYKEKVNYTKSLLPMLASLRRKTGLPHRIVVDEAHYFLHDPNAKELLDLTLGAYTFVTYRLSDLNADLRKEIQAIIIKRTTHDREVQTLVSMMGDQQAKTDWKSVMASLAMQEAVLLPGIEEAEGKMVKFTLSLD